MSNPTLLLRTILVVVFAGLPFAVRAQLTSAALNFENELGTENAIALNNFSLNSSHTQSGVAVGGAATIENGSVLNQDNYYKDDPYSLRVYGQLTLAGGSDQSLNGGATFVQNGTTNVGLKDFPMNGGQQRVITFGSSSSAQPQIALNGNSGPPASTKFIGAADNYFTSRDSVLSSASSVFANATAVTPTNTGGTLTFNAAPGTITVFNWDVAKQGSISQVAINAAAGSDAIINVFDVPGNNWSPSFNFIGNGATAASATRVLWNLEGNLNLTTDREWWGSILGVGASITDDQDIDGQIFADNLAVNSGELHYDQFAPIPEPSTYATLAGLAALAVAAAHRRSRRKAGCTVSGVILDFSRRSE
ncbi:MAG: choice-of-anchor A family protein [Opitutaceae bacterium]|jgi:choice-of-anchor A domain-containing protein/MYXO-CTERM domain-containing protein